MNIAFKPSITCYGYTAPFYNTNTLYSLYLHNLFIYIHHVTGTDRISFIRSNTPNITHPSCHDMIYSIHAPQKGKLIDQKLFCLSICTSATAFNDRMDGKCQVLIWGHLICRELHCNYVDSHMQIYNNCFIHKLLITDYSFLVVDNIANQC